MSRITKCTISNLGARKGESVEDRENGEMATSSSSLSHLAVSQRVSHCVILEND